MVKLLFYIMHSVLQSKAAHPTYGDSLELTLIQRSEMVQQASEFVAQL